MADASRLKARADLKARPGALGAPPPLAEARTDLAPPPTAPPEASPAAGPVRIDGRTLRRSGRTVQFATRVSPGFDERLRRLAMQEGVLLVEILERALDLYASSRKEAAR